jgi:hypothetical protein
MKHTFKHIWHTITSSFKSRIGTNYKTKQHQYYNFWTNKVWFEDFK